MVAEERRSSSKEEKKSEKKQDGRMKPERNERGQREKVWYQEGRLKETVAAEARPVHRGECCHVEPCHFPLA